ncbi:response regulator [Pontibacter akesuensis]|uniref:Response regulatory domain-containing protein n=1 Tax=Pontibacter akesuensis TaxID=388950 RepID=A0A1I7JC49_9BACT|nr:hypothetical protein [Pontibacter akesuensis]GHA71035.1 hypothetical protein GCM10007389_25590 [Pontibacter akesuensis]SFU82797.1 hypothetical protein SAMN04487941_2707 [Pontibacter akesuensis]
MRQIDLLIVEDEDKNYRLYEQTIKAFNRETGVTIKPERAKDLVEAEKLLVHHNYDAAIVDIILKTGGTEDNADGVDILRKIVGKLRFPVFVYSGNPGLINGEEFEQNYFFKIHARDGIEFIELLKEIVKIFQTGITNVLGGKGKVESYLASLFWNHLIHTMDYWQDNSALREEKDYEKILLRYTIFHLVETLYRTDTGEHEIHDPSEFYIYPAINDNLFTGDIIEIETEKYIVLTPACDMVLHKNHKRKDENDPLMVRNASNFIAAKLIKWNRLKDEKNDFNEISSASSSIIRGEFKKHIKNTVNRYHFLPPYLSFDGYFIDFQDLHSFSIKEKPVYRILASVASSFMKDITARFSYYYSRQGQPDMDMEAIGKKLLDEQSKILKAKDLKKDSDGTAATE